MPPLLHSRRLSGKYGIHGEKMCFCFYFILSSCLCVLEGYKDGGCKNKAKRNNNSFFHFRHPSLLYFFKDRRSVIYYEIYCRLLFAGTA